MRDNYIESIQKQFRYAKSLADNTFAQLDTDQIFWQNSEADNSIAIIAKHIAGNMLSRWTNFYTEDGEKDWRKRDQEFINTFKSKKDVLDYWESGWECLNAIIETLRPEDLDRIIYIRNEGHTALEAINRQLGHYSYHIGQIVLLGKQILGENWKNLSVPKGQSASYNLQKFSKTRHRGHFTDNL